MISKKALITLAVVAASILCGCSDDHGDGIKPSDKQALTDLNSQAKAADGKFEALPDDAKKKILDMAHGDEKQAKNLTMMMAHPPGEANQSAHGGPPGTH